MEVFFRILSIIFLVMTACLVAFDAQTKLLYGLIIRKATFRDLNALYVLVWIATAAAAYNVLQLFRFYLFPGLRKDGSPSSRYLSWGFYLLDQGAVYMVFAANTAAFQASTLAVTGEKSFQWMKLCDKYHRFCVQIGGALLCGCLASIFMAITSSISAYSLFRLYSPKQFLQPKAK